MSSYILPMTMDIEKRIIGNPLLNIDTFIIPSPYIKKPDIQKDFNNSFVWIEEGEILGYMLTYSNTNKDYFLIYKVVTSPFGRRRGIGTALIEHLAQNISS
ncbi:MAG: GNAT family N-acetyltransferase, partial [Spirochaetales bacterium]|nr:GNAT family N-acetyltransferase [Spirochaetales bacterium]